MTKCAVENCWSVSKNKRLSFHRLPKDSVIRKRWIEICRFNGRRNYQLIRICSLHFKKRDFHNNSKSSMKLKNNAVPSVFKTDDSISKDNSLYRSQKRDIRSYLIDTQRRVAVKKFLDSFFDRRNVLTFLANLYNNPPVVSDKNKLKIQRLREVIRKLNRRNKKLNELYKYWKEVSAAKTELLKNTLFEKQKKLYMSS